MKKILALTLVTTLAVSACDKAQDTVGDAADKVMDKTAEVADKGVDAVKDGVAAVENSAVVGKGKEAVDAVAKKVGAYKSEKDQLGYAFGYQFAKNLEQNELQKDISASSVNDAISDVLSGKEARMSDQEMANAVQVFRERKMEEAKAVSEESKKKGEEFLATNKAKEGILTTESGLQYKVLEQGKGATPEDGKSVEVNYKGTLVDGTVFDSSYDRGQSATFPVNGVIPGFTEGLKLMKEGGKYVFYIPSDLAYGDQAPPSIGANQTLIFEVELIKVK